MSDHALVPVEQREIQFYDDTILAIRMQDGQILVPVRQIANAIGLSWSGQFERLKRDPILSEELTSVRVTRTQDQARELLCLPLGRINGWLFKANPTRIKDPEKRATLIRYQRDCYDILFQAFGPTGVAVRPDAAMEEVLARDPDLREAYNMATAVLSLIRSQARLQSNLDDHERRLQIIEADRGDETRQITNQQAKDISQAIKLIGAELSKQSGKNEFGGVYGQFYRQFGIVKYAQLPAVRFVEAMNWLRQWWQRLTDDDVPF